MAPLAVRTTGSSRDGRNGGRPSATGSSGPRTVGTGSRVTGIPVGVAGSAPAWSAWVGCACSAPVAVGVGLGSVGVGVGLGCAALVGPASARLGDGVAGGRLAVGVGGGGAGRSSGLTWTSSVSSTSGLSARYAFMKACQVSPGRPRP